MPKAHSCIRGIEKVDLAVVEQALITGSRNNPLLQATDCKVRDAQYFDRFSGASQSLAHYFLISISLR